MKRPLFRLVPYRILPRINWFLIATTLALAVFGIVTLWGATSSGDGPGPFAGYARKQAIFLLIGIGLMAGLIMIDYRRLRVLIWPLYGFNIALLAGVLVKGHIIKGAQSWYALGPIHLQPSEPAKLIVVLVLAHYLASRVKRFRGLHHTLIPLAIVLLPMALILRQPDLGSAVVFIPITGAIFWTAGLRKWVIVLFVILGALAVYKVVPHLKPYQKDRLMAFMHPEADPLGYGWNIIQAKTALGSGQLLGKGWGRGTQTNFRFLPEYHTDFIFPTVGEQFGMVGACLALSLMLLQIGLIARVAQQTQDLFGVLTATGMAAMLATHVFFNVGMATGMLPVTGLPLPFFSYGGSFMITCMIAVGLVVGIGARRDL